eukprot:4847598-Alexandrium_andersonii.AAC.1
MEALHAAQRLERQAQLLGEGCNFLGVQVSNDSIPRCWRARPAAPCHWMLGLCIDVSVVVNG